MFELLKKLLKISPGPHFYLELPACEPNLIQKKLSYDELRLIFNLLDYKTLIKCRRVCALFRSVVDNMKFLKLFVFDGAVKEKDIRTFPGDRKPTASNLIKLPQYTSYIACQTILRSAGFQKLFANLKVLRLLCFVYDTHLDHLNSFVELEELSIFKVKCPSRSKPTLRLPKLEVLAFNLVLEQNVGEPLLVLHTPSLRRLFAWGNLDLIQFDFPEVIKRLQIWDHEWNRGLEEKFRSFKNLNGFSCSDPKFLLDFDVLKLKPDLEWIQCCRLWEGNELGVVGRLLEQKRTRNLSVMIYYDDKLVNDIFDLRKLKVPNY